MKSRDTYVANDESSFVHRVVAGVTSNRYYLKYLYGLIAAVLSFLRPNQRIPDDITHPSESMWFGAYVPYHSWGSTLIIIILLGFKKYDSLGIYFFHWVVQDRPYAWCKGRY